MDDAAIYEARLEIVDFLTDVFWNVPDEQFLERLLGGEIHLPDESVSEAFDEGFEALRAFRERNSNRPVKEIAHDVHVEYTSLFAGPRPPVLPHETYYRDDTEFIGEGLANVESSYAAVGWTPPENYAEENDFIAVELAFLRHLIRRQRDGADEAVGYERVFLDEHLMAWYADFVSDLLDNTDEPLFRAGAHLFQGLVEFEDELVAQMA